MKLWTSRLHYGGPDRLDVSLSGNDPLGKHFAPPKALLDTYLKLRNERPNKRVTDEEFRAYATQFIDHMREVYTADRSPFRALLEREQATLVCFCPHADQCHRTVLAEKILSRFANVEVMGERDEASVRHANHKARHSQQVTLFDEPDPPEAPASAPALAGRRPKVKGLSLIQPWAELVLRHEKRCENREWPLHKSMIGRAFLLHASKKAEGSFWDAQSFLQERGLKIEISSLADAPRGGIVGWARVVGYLEPHTEGPVPEAIERWWQPNLYGFVLSEAHPLPFTPLSGAPGFFDVPDEVVASLPLPPSFWERERAWSLRTG